jgi:hypothetical protein
MSKPLVQEVPLSCSEESGWFVEDRVTGLTLIAPGNHDAASTDVYLEQFLGWLAKERPDWYLRLVSRRQVSEAEEALANGALRASVAKRGSDGDAG